MRAKEKHSMPNQISKQHTREEEKIVLNLYKMFVRIVV